MMYTSSTSLTSVSAVVLSTLLALASPAAFGQGWGHREAMRPWLEGRFEDAERIFAERRIDRGPVIRAQSFCWEAEFAIERARYGIASALLSQAKRVETFDSASSEMREKRLARLYLSTGRFADAEREALNGRKWDGTDIRQLKLPFAMSLTTLGEVYLAKGRPSEAIAILGKAAKEAKSTSSIDGAEWIRARNDSALASAALGSIATALQMAEETQSAAIREWGATSIPATDSLHTIGVICLLGKRLGDAQQALARSRALREALYGPEHPKVADSYMQAAMLAAAEGHPVVAARLANQSLAIEKSLAAGGAMGRWAYALAIAAPVFAASGDDAAASECYSSAIPVLETELGRDAPTVEEARRQFIAISARHATAN